VSDLQAIIDQSSNGVPPKPQEDLWKAYGVPRNGDLYPRILLERAVQWGIPKEALRCTCAYDRVLLKHVMPLGVEGRWNEKTGKVEHFYGSEGIIEIPEFSKEKLQNTAPRVLIISAGLDALAQLRTNGINIGHYVHIQKLSPYRMPMDYNAGVPYLLTSARAPDVQNCEDTTRLLNEGKLVRKWRRDKDFVGFVYEKGPGFENDPEVSYITGAPPVDVESWSDL